MKRIFLFFFLLISLIQSSFSQGEFLKRGKSGFGAGAGFSTNSEANGKTLYAGFSYKGFLDLNLTYWKKSGGKTQDAVLSPSVTFYPIKQEDSKKTPTLGISLGYSRFRSKSTSFEDVPLPLSQHRTDTIITNKMLDAVSFSANAYHRIGFWKAFFFQPVIGAGATVTTSGWEFVLRGGVTIGTKIKRGPLLLYTPSVERQSGVTTFVFTFGIVY